MRRTIDDHAAYVYFGESDRYLNFWILRKLGIASFINTLCLLGVVGGGGLVQPQSILTRESSTTTIHTPDVVDSLDARCSKGLHRDGPPRVSRAAVGRANTPIRHELHYSISAG
jgi:hypothetical protein